MVRLSIMALHNRIATLCRVAKAHARYPPMSLVSITYASGYNFSTFDGPDWTADGALTFHHRSAGRLRYILPAQWDTPRVPLSHAMRVAALAARSKRAVRSISSRFDSAAQCPPQGQSKGSARMVRGGLRVARRCAVATVVGADSNTLILAAVAVRHRVERSLLSKRGPRSWAAAPAGTYSAL